MIIKRKNQQKKFKSPICGYLVDVVKTENFGIVKADNIEVTEKHYHKKTTEVYHLIEGEVTLEVKEKGKKEATVTLKSGDVLVLQPYDVHKVIKASKKNELIVTCVPDWREDDEIVVE
jgi:mannose-6-phosphate isomerase-like protein (cupin superfamily)